MIKKELEALVLSLQIKLQWVTSEIDKRDAIIAAQAAKSPVGSKGMKVTALS